MSAQASETMEARLAKLPLLRLDTRTVVGSLLLAVAFSANMQITERLDQIWTGGLAVPLGATFFQLWGPTAVVFFGLTGALILSNFNPIIAVLSATHPLAWSFFFLNMANSIPMTFLMRWHLRTKGELTLIPLMIYVAISESAALIVEAVGIHANLLHLPLGTIVWLFLWQLLMGVFIGAPMGYYFYKSVARAGVFR